MIIPLNDIIQVVINGIIAGVKIGSLACLGLHLSNITGRWVVNLQQILSNFSEIL